MAIEADFSVAVNGDIRHESGTAHYTVLELHRFLQDIADDESPATANDYVDITSLGRQTILLHLSMVIILMMTLPNISMMAQLLRMTEIQFIQD